MRIKLRLYARDLDLIALKYNHCFHFNKALRTALVEFVRNQKCTRISVPVVVLPEIILQEECVNISLDEKQHADVIAWLNGIRNGMRSYAIKAVFRSAIENPILDLFNAESVLVIDKAPITTTPTQTDKTVKDSPEKSDVVTPQSVVEQSLSTDNPVDANGDLDEKTLDLFEDVFELY